MPTPQEPTDRTFNPIEIIRRLGPAGVLGALWCILPGVAGIVLLTRIRFMSEWLSEYSEGEAIAIYVGVFIVSAGCGFLPTYAQAILGGWIFNAPIGGWTFRVPISSTPVGIPIGIPAALAGFTGGSLIGYAVTRIVTRDRVERLIQEDARAMAIREVLIGHGFWRTLGIVTLIRVPPNSPFALTSLVMASAGVRVLPYVLGTAIGMAPRTAIAVFFAAAAANTGAEDIQSFVKHGLGMWWMLGGLVVMLIVLGILGLIANRAIDQVVLRPNRERSSSAGDPDSSTALNEVGP